jgi:hypothetical protein
MALKITGTVDAAASGDTTGADTKEGLESPFYRVQKHVASADGELALVFEDDLFAVGVNATLGENSAYTRPVGQTWGNIFDLPQAYGKLKLGPVYFLMGRVYSSMGAEVVPAMDNNFIFRSVNFGFVPFTNTQTAVGIAKKDAFDISLAFSMGPDRLPWADNNGAPYFAFNATVPNVVADKINLSFNAQMGPEKDKDAGNWRKTLDFTAELIPVPNVLAFKLYYLFSAENFDGRAQLLHGANFYAKLDPSDSLQFLLRAGYLHDVGGRSGINNLELLQGTFGVGYKFKTGTTGNSQIRLQVDGLAALNGVTPFSKTDSFTRFGLQYVYGDVILNNP